MRGVGVSGGREPVLMDELEQAVSPSISLLLLDQY